MKSVVLSLFLLVAGLIFFASRPGDHGWAYISDSEASSVIGGQEGCLTLYWWECWWIDSSCPKKAGGGFAENDPMQGCPLKVSVKITGWVTCGDNACIIASLGESCVE